MHCSLLFRTVRGLSIAVLGTLCGAGCSVYDAGRLEVNSTGAAIGAAGALAAPPTAGKAGSSPSTDPDAEPVATRCGDGIISGAEKCDLGIEAGEAGACPSACPALTPCAPRALNGTACQAECVLLTPSCTHGDGCCPGSCVAGNDDDCSPSCGDGVVDPSLGETCETEGEQACKTSAEECDDGDTCTMDTLIGSADNCSSECLAVPVTSLDADGCCAPGANANTDEDCQPICGNGVLEAGEECDQSEGCSADCRVTMQPGDLACSESARDACERCTCQHCTAEHLACRNGPEATQNELCSAIVDCSRREQCLGTPCYCGDPPVCGVPRGPCQTEIEAAAGTRDPWEIERQRLDPSTTVGKAMAYSACRARNCSDACAPTTN